MSSRRFVPLCAAWVLAATAVPVLAQPTAALPAYKVGYVNAQRVIRESTTSKKAQQLLEDEFAKREKEIAGGPAREAPRRHSALVADMTQRRDEALKKIVDRADAIIRRIAEAERFDIVLYEAAYVGPQADLTERVMKALDEGR